MFKILLIERSATFRHSIRKQLSKKDFEITSADSYQSGLKLLMNLPTGVKAFDGVVIGWPERTDPFADEILVSLCSDKLDSLPKLVLSEDGDPAKLDWVTNHPGAAVLPWSAYREIPAILIELIQSTRQLRQIQKTPIDSQPLRILIIDDSPSVRFKFRKLLQKKGYSVETASSAAEGMDLVLNVPIDVAIIDYYMPNENGDVLVRRLKQDNRTKGIICCILTGTYSDHVTRECLDAGAVECMFKNESQELFLTRVRSLCRSVLDRRSIENERRYLKSVLSSVGDGVYGVDKNGTIEFVNQAVCRILGYSEPVDLIGKSAHRFFHYAAENNVIVEKEKCELSSCYAMGRYLTNWRTVFWKKNGSFLHIECTVFPIMVDNQCEGSVVAFRDISDRKTFEEELRWQATHDSLTKLPNRSYFEDSLEHEINRLRRAGECSALLFIDIDRFKYINDTAGHAVGDQVLIEVSQRLRSRLRSSDIAARISGDEFAIILHNAGDDKEKIHKTVDAFRKVLEDERFYCGGKAYSVTITIGVDVLDKHTRSPGEAMSNADMACYIAKGQGRNQTHIFSPELDNKADMDIELGWSTRLRDALKRNLFILNFQPILSMSRMNSMSSNLEFAWDGSMDDSLVEYINYEVLIRLRDQSEGVILPSAFLPTAERFDMMTEIDKWVIDHAFAALAKELKKGRKLNFFINLSAQTLGHSNIVYYVKDRLAHYQIDPQRITFEITETAVLTNIKTAKDLISELRQLGCSFALDDFGSGFSSFSHLKHLEVDVIKIDGQFIRGVADNKVDRAVIMAITKISRALGKKTVAEFVESLDMLSALAAVGVDYVQGFHIGKPFFEPHEIELPTTLANNKSHMNGNGSHSSIIN